MRTFSLALLPLLLIACQNNDEHPPLLPDTDSGTPISPGGGPTGNDGASDAAEGGAVTTASNPKGIFVTNGLVYYTNFASGAGDGTVSVVPISGGAHTDLATGLSAPSAITVAAGTVYFTLAPVGTGGVSSVPAIGGSVTSLQTGVTSALGIAADGTNVFWTSDSGSGALLWFVPLAGGTPKQLLDFGGALSPTGLLITATDVFIPTDGAQAAILAGTTGGTNLAPLDTQQSITYADVAASSTTVYATVDDVAPAGAIVAFPRAGGPAKTVVGNLNHPQHLALDGTHLYFTDPDGGNVWVVDISQTTPAATLVASGLVLPLPIAVADALYVGAADSIVRIPKL